MRSDDCNDGAPASRKAGNNPQTYLLIFTNVTELLRFNVRRPPTKTRIRLPFFFGVFFFKYVADIPAQPPKGRDVPERITRAIWQAKAAWTAEHPEQPFTLTRATEAARAQWRLEKGPRLNGDGRDELFDAIVTACGGELDALTRQYSAQVATAKRDILEATPDVTADEVVRRSVRYRAVYRDAPCTPSALAKHWPEFPLNGHSKGGPKKPGMYVEPEGWQNVLRKIGAGWDRATVQLNCQTPWLDVSHTIRQEILKHY